MYTEDVKKELDKVLCDFCEAVSEACEEKNITIGYLAELSGVERSALSRILRLKRKPSLETIIRLSRTLKIEFSIQDMISE